MQEKKKIKKEFLEERQFNRMIGTQTEELIQREKVEEKEIKRKK